MARLLILAMCFLFATDHSNAQQLNPFTKLKYDKVVAYEYDGEGDVFIVDDHGKLANPIITKRVLSKQQIAEINSIMADTATYGGITAACFDPHLGIVYYYGNKIVAHVSICMECNYLQTSKNIKLAGPTYHHHTIGDASVESEGFSKAGRKRISAFTNSLGFKYSHTTDGNPFDE